MKEKKPKDKGIKEKYIENLFCQNLENIFSGWISLSQQCYLEHPEKDEENCIVDSLAFNKSSENFLIMEYKKEKAAELVYQAEKYMECLEDEEKGIVIRNRNKLVDILNNNEAFKKTKGIWKEEEIKWDEIKAICITTEIHGYQKILKRKPRKNIHVLEIKFYEESFLSIDCEKLPDWLKVGSNLHNSSSQPSQSDSFHIQIFSEFMQKYENYFDPKIKKNLMDFNEWISEKTCDLKIPSSALYLNYFWKTYSKIIAFSLVPWKKQINVYWNFAEPEKISDGLDEILKKWNFEWENKSHLGNGDWKFPIIKDDNDLHNLKEFIREYLKYCEANENWVKDLWKTIEKK